MKFKLSTKVTGGQRNGNAAEIVMEGVQVDLIENYRNIQL